MSDFFKPAPRTENALQRRLSPLIAAVTGHLPMLTFTAVYLGILAILLAPQGFFIGAP